MKLATNLEYFLKNMDITKAARVLEEAGFAHVDYTPELKRFQWKSFEKDLEILRALWQSGYFAGRRALERIRTFWTEAV